MAIQSFVYLTNRPGLKDMLEDAQTNVIQQMHMVTEGELPVEVLKAACRYLAELEEFAAQAEGREVRLVSGDEAEEAYRQQWVRTYAKRLGGSLEWAEESFCIFFSGWEGIVCPWTTIAAAGSVQADHDAARFQAFQKMAG